MASRSCLQVFSLCILSLALGAGEAAPDASQYLPENALATARLNDLQRSRERFVTSPYAKLLDTGWGKLVNKKWQEGSAAAAKEGIDIPALLGGLKQVVAGLAMGEQAKQPDIGVAFLTQGNTAPFQAWCAKMLMAEAALGAGGKSKVWLGGAGQITQFDQLFVFQSAPADGGAVEEAKPRSPVKASAFPGACLEGQMDLQGLFALFTRLTKVPNRLVKSGMLSSLSFSLALDPIGLRERWAMPFAPKHAAELKAMVLPPADLALLRSLPATVLFALVTHVDPATSAKQLELTGITDDDPELAQVNSVLTGAGLPKYVEMIGAIDGDLVAYCEEGVPFPTGTLAMGVKEEVAGKLLAMLKEKLSMSDNGDGSFSGFLGVVTLQAAYQKGQLVLTTNPTGIAGFNQRRPGFADLPEIKAALAEIKPGAIAAGVSRSGASWAAFAQLAMVPISQFGLDPKIMSLPQDLRAVGKYGFFSYARGEDGFVFEAGGLAGGIFGAYSMLLGGVAGYWYYEMGMIRQQMNAPVPQAPAPAPNPGNGDQVF